MPTITIQGRTFACPVGTNLRQALLSQGIALDNGSATVINCRALGTGGTGAVKITGAVSLLRDWQLNNIPTVGCVSAQQNASP
jgi:ferredoxin